MKIFNRTKTWPTKVNFVDQNNVFVGYDTEYQCCESFGWYISESPFIHFKLPIADCPDEYHPGDEMLESYIFDTKYFKCVDDPNSPDGTAVAFRLVSSGKPDLYLTLYNYHNGYYSHGFQFGTHKPLENGSYIMETCIEEDCI